MSQAEFKKRLKALMIRPENAVCSDCPERQPRWASLIKPPPGAPPGSIGIGAFCCLECSGSHRRLGVHISFVRSVNLDQWKETEVLMMENGGNAKVNAIFEAHLSVNKPTNAATGPVRERFIRDKYERRKFYDPTAFERVSQLESAREQEKVVSGVQRRLASSGSRKPSDAAKKRVEERAARRGGGGSAVRGTKTAKAPARVVAPSPLPAPAVDLLDFGNFDSPEANSAVQASVGVTANPAPPPAAASNQEPQLDFFASTAVSSNPGEVVANGHMQNSGQPGQAASTEQPAKQKKMSTSDIMSMFNNGSAQHNPVQQNMFAMQGGMPNNSMMGQQRGGGGMNANNMATMNNVNPQQQMVMMNNMHMMQQKNNVLGQPQQGMGNMGGNNMNMMNNMQMMQQKNSLLGQTQPGMGNLVGNNMNMMNNGQPQQGMGNMGGNNMGNSMSMMNNMQMMQQRNNMIGQQQQGMSNMGGNNMGTNMSNMAQNGMMMHQQQQGQMPQMNNMIAGNNSMMMQGGGGGGMMHQEQGGNQYVQSSLGGQAQQMQGQPSSQNQMNQFSNYGNFGR